MWTLKKELSSLWLEKNGRAFVGNDVYLMIRPDPVSGYNVKGIVGFGGMGYNGPMSTRSLVKGLNALGLSVTAKSLRAALKAA